MNGVFTTPDDSAVELLEDVTGRRAVSISDVDSDPLEFRHRVGGSRSVSGASSMHGSDDDDFDMNDDGGLEDADAKSAASSTGGAPKGSRVVNSVEEADLFGLDVAGDTALGKQDVSKVSEGFIATIESCILRSSTLVVKHRQESLMLDCGTRLCLVDGTVVGTISTLLGPVQDCLYAVVCDSATLASLHMDGKIDEGMLLYYDLTKQHVLYDPASIAQQSAQSTTDASFTNDDERPVGMRPDFSDDDDEKQWKQQRKKRKLLLAAGCAGVPASSSSAAAANVEDEVVSSSDGSEAEFDDEGAVIAYRARRDNRRQAPNPTSAVDDNFASHARAHYLTGSGPAMPVHQRPMKDPRLEYNTGSHHAVASHQPTSLPPMVSVTVGVAGMPMPFPYSPYPAYPAAPMYGAQLQHSYADASATAGAPLQDQQTIQLTKPPWFTSSHGV